jgi:anti-sigma B factor antagonist
MPLSVTQKGSVTVATVGDSKLTYPVLEPFFEGLRTVVEDGARRLVVDFAAVAFIDSPTIGCIIDVHRLLQERGGAVKLAGLQPRIGTLFSMTGVLKMLDVHATAAEAVAAFGGKSAGTPQVGP